MELYTTWPSVSGVFQGSPMLCMYQYIIPFDSPTVIHCVDTPACLPFISWQRLGCFRFLTISDNADGNVHVQVSVWMCFSLPLGVCRGPELLGRGISMFNVSRICQTVFQRCCPTLPSYQQWRAPVSPHPCQHLWLLVFLFGHPAGVKGCLTALVFIFLMTYVVEHLFMCLLAMVALEKCLFKFLDCLYNYACFM